MAQNSVSLHKATLLSKEEESLEKAYHCISYIPINSFLYQLGGRKGGRVKVGDCDDAHISFFDCPLTVTIVESHIEAKFITCTSRKLKCSLLALGDPDFIAFQSSETEAREREAEAGEGVAEGSERPAFFRSNVFNNREVRFA